MKLLNKYILFSSLQIYFIKIKINSVINYMFTKLCSVLHESSKKIWSWIKFAEILNNMPEQIPTGYQQMVKRNTQNPK